MKSYMKNSTGGEGGWGNADVQIELRWEHEIRIPTVEYGYVSENFIGTPQEAFERHNELLGLSRGGIGLPDKEWRELLDKYLDGKGCTPEEYYKGNKEQQLLLSEIKKSMSRRGVRNQKI